ncbi:MAG: HAD family hydrolase [Clostridia bacterium]|nr:HAD family hydrolase [Clostridia bacterium]
MQYEAILFDVGDTLIEYEPDLGSYYLQRLRKICPQLLEDSLRTELFAAVKNAEYAQLMKEYLGAPRMPDDDFMTMMDRAAVEVIFPGEADGWLPKLQETPAPRMKKMVKAEIRGVLRQLSARVRLGVVSNYTSDLLKYLQEMQLAEFFETIVISETVGVEKPDPHIMEIALNDMGLSPEKCLYVGDHPFDVLCARRAGMDCAWLAPPQANLPDGIGCEETMRIGSLTELLALVG